MVFLNVQAPLLSHSVPLTRKAIAQTLTSVNLAFLILQSKKYQLPSKMYLTQLFNRTNAPFERQNIALYVIIHFHTEKRLESYITLQLMLLRHPRLKLWNLY